MADELKTVLKIAAALKVVKDIDETKKISKAQLVEIKKQTALMELALEQQKNKEENEKIDREYNEVIERQKQESEEEIKRQDHFEEEMREWSLECRENGLSTNAWEVAKACKKKIGINYYNPEGRNNFWLTIQTFAEKNDLKFLLDDSCNSTDFLKTYYKNESQKELLNFISYSDLAKEALTNAIAMTVSGKEVDFSRALGNSIEHYMQVDNNKQKMNIAVMINGKVRPAVIALHEIRKAVDLKRNEVSKCFGFKTLITMAGVGLFDYLAIWGGENNPKYILEKSIASFFLIGGPVFLFIGVLGEISKAKKLKLDLSNLESKMRELELNPFSITLSESEEKNLIARLFELKTLRTNELNQPKKRNSKNSELLELHEMNLSDEEVASMYFEHRKAA